MNDFEKVKSLEEIHDGGLILTPKGIGMPETYWKRIPIGPPQIKDITNTEWKEDILISSEGSSADYSTRVDWWVNNAIEDPVWVEKVETTFKHMGFDPYRSIDKTSIWLKSRLRSQRKCNVRKLYWNRLTTDSDHFLKTRKEHNV